MSLIKREPGDLLVTKSFANAFHQTTLASQLKALKVSFLILCGQAADQCVVFSYNGAQEQGVSATVLQDGVISPQPGRADMLFRDRTVISYPVIKALLS
ncbi:cysteine hydrolase family protein [Reinekea sp. G2M2-21]|uniref:cysteine hydrolase family protein n=1 Tax=Reinekea sp. G2M2-21 TaxID=2788942 RepID=UPI0018A929F7|nr:isochorismatase family protein [Reinekea sp. G2M2-21]